MLKAVVVASSSGKIVCNACRFETNVHNSCTVLLSGSSKSFSLIEFGNPLINASQIRRVHSADLLTPVASGKAISAKRVMSVR